MPTISMFYGLIIRMYYFDNQQYNMPHIHENTKITKQLSKFRQVDWLQVV